MAVTKAKGDSAPEYAPALIEALGRKASIGIAVHEGEFVIPRGVVAASPQLVGAIEKAFQKASEITGEPMDWLDYVAREGNNARRVFDAGPGDESDSESADAAAGVGAGDVGGVGDSGGGYGDYGDYEGFGYDGFMNEDLGFGAAPTSTGGRAGLALASLAMGPVAGVVSGFGGAMNALDATPGTQADFEGYSGAGNPGMDGGGLDQTVRWPSYAGGQAANVAAPAYSRPGAPDLAGFGGLFGGMDDRQVRTAIASRALHDDPNRSYYMDDPDITGTYNTLARRALINDDGGLNAITGTLQPVELAYLNRARGLSFQHDNTDQLLGMLG